MPEPIAIILAAVLGALITGYSTYRAMLNSAKLAIPERHPLLGSVVMISLKVFMKISTLVGNIFNQTTADRFLILGAHNGKEMLRFASAYYEQHKETGSDGEEPIMISFGAVSRYVNFEFDDQYRKMLKQAELDGLVELKVKDMPDCDLKNIYQAERIHHSKVYFIERIKNYDKKENDLILFASVAKHGLEPFIPSEKTIIKTYMGQIQALIKQTTHEPTN